MKKHDLTENIVVIAVDFMMKHGKLKTAFRAGRESFSIPDSTETNESTIEWEKEVEKGTEKRISLDEDIMIEKDKEHDKSSPRAPNDEAMVMEFRDELVRKSLEQECEGKSQNETSEKKEYEGSICSTSFVFEENASNRLEMLETNLALVAKRLTELEERMEIKTMTYLLTKYCIGSVFLKERIKVSKQKYKN